MGHDFFIAGTIPLELIEQEIKATFGHQQWQTVEKARQFFRDKEFTQEFRLRLTGSFARRLLLSYCFDKTIRVGDLDFSITRKMQGSQDEKVATHAFVAELYQAVTGKQYQHDNIDFSLSLQPTQSFLISSIHPLIDMLNGEVLFYSEQAYQQFIAGIVEIPEITQLVTKDLDLNQFPAKQKALIDQKEALNGTFREHWLALKQQMHSVEAGRKRLGHFLYATIPFIQHGFVVNRSSAR
jgi:hypothetical protein